MPPINLDTRDLEAVLAVAESGSFRAAARVLGISQPSVTARIQKVEALLGQALFTRTTRRVVITEAGERLRVRAADTVAQLRHLLEDFAEEVTLKRGRVRLGATPTAASSVVPPVLQRFRRRWPDVEVRLVDNFFGRDLGRLASGEVDFAILPFSPQEEQFRFQPLLDDDFVFILPAGHRLAVKAAVRLADTVGEKILTSPASSAAWGTFVEAFTKAGLVFQPDFETMNISTLVALVRAGLGISLMPRLALAQINLEGIEQRPISDEPLRRKLGIVTVRNRALSPAVEALLTAFRRSVHSRPAMPDGGEWSEAGKRRADRG